jgi:hypothetical protein
MNIPACYDPVYQEERQQMEQDKLHDSLPCCALCSRTLYPGDKIRVTLHRPVCKCCFEELEENEDIVELD